MKIEYLNNINPAEPKKSILRIFDFDTTESCQFKDILAKLANGSDLAVDMHNLPFVEGVDGCRLILKVGKRDEGIRKINNNNFECVLRSISWDNAEGLVEPFCEKDIKGSFQWLYDLICDIDLLFSPDGLW